MPIEQHEQLFDLLHPAGQSFVRTPSLAKLIALLPDHRLQRCKSIAGLYWEVYTAVGETGATGLLDSGLESSGARNLGLHNNQPNEMARSMTDRERQMRLARDILGLIAFDMMCGKKGQGTDAPIRYNKKTFGPFRDRIMEKLEMRKPDLYHGIVDAYLNNDLNCILETNFIGLNCTQERLDKEVEDKFISVRNFFAAFWAARWADASDRHLMMNWMPDDDRVDREAYREFWTFFQGLKIIQEPDEKDCAFEPRNWEAIASAYNGESPKMPELVDPEEQSQIEQLKKDWAEHVKNKWESQWLKVNLSDDDQNPHWVSTGSLEFLEYKRTHPDNWYHLVEKARDKPPN